MFPLPDFDLIKDDQLSTSFVSNGCCTFYQAVSYIKQLPYGRNSDKEDIMCVLKEQIGTCSTKHAILKRLADTYKQYDIKLMMGIFKMDGEYAPNIKPILDRNHLLYIPEAHNYLMFNNERIDCTSKRSRPEDFEHKLLEEIEITPDQITEFKVSYHKQFLSKWLDINKLSVSSLDGIWQIREDCVKALSAN